MALENVVSFEKSPSLEGKFARRFPGAEYSVKRAIQQRRDFAEPVGTELV